MNDKLMGTRTIVFELDDVQVAWTEDVNGILWELSYPQGAGEDVLAQAMSCMPNGGRYQTVEVDEDVTYFRLLDPSG